VNNALIIGFLIWKAIDPVARELTPLGRLEELAKKMLEAGFSEAEVSDAWRNESESYQMKLRIAQAIRRETESDLHE
jgi:uncharacterized protein YabN with tetrapyrrole methylase and pyrophosphatase domain